MAGVVADALKGEKFRLGPTDCRARPERLRGPMGQRRSIRLKEEKFRLGLER